MSLRRFLVLVVMAATVSAGAARALAAQGGIDVIRGRILKNPENTPIPDVLVTVVDTGTTITKVVRTDKDGRFTVVFGGGGGDYWITLAAVGYTGRRYELRRNADEDVLIADAKMTATTTTLAPMRTQGLRLRPSRDDSLFDIGHNARTVDLATVGIDIMGDLNAMAATLPGVLMMTADDGSSAGISVLGLDPSQNAIMIDGAASSTANLPRDAQISVSVNTSNYDVSAGRSSGAITNAFVAGGGNFNVRRTSWVFDTPPLQWTDQAANSLGTRYTKLSIGGAASGPIMLNKMFYSTSYEVDHQYSGLASLLSTDAAGLQAAGVSSDSVARFASLLGGYGIPTTLASIPPSLRTDNVSATGRLDLSPPYSTSGQQFSISGRVSGRRSAPFGTSASLATRLPASSGESSQWSASGSARHTGYFSFGVLSSTNVGVNISHSATTPYLDMPSGAVRVGSTFPDGTAGITTLTLGGGSTASHSTTSSASAVNSMSWYSPSNTQTIKVTGELYADGVSSVSYANEFGAFSYNSLGDFANNTPAQFSRQLTPRTQALNQVAIGTSIGDGWRPVNDVQFRIGLRLDGNRFLTSPQFDPAVEQLFGLHNDHVPDRIYASPRAGFSWAYGTAAQVGTYQGSARIPRALISGGVGFFQNVSSASLISSAVANTGLPSAVQQIRCIGVAAPTPDWNAYDASSASIPDQCADGTAGTVFASTVPGVTVYDPTYQQPRSLRGNLQWNGPVVDNRFNASINATYSRNQHAAGSVDLNFVPTVRFDLANEDGRPVYVNPGSIVPASGQIASHDARITQQFASVTELRSDLLSVTHQVTMSVSPLGYNPAFSWNFTYVNNGTRDRQRGFGANTDGDPLVVESGRSSLDWHHEFTLGLNVLLWNTVPLSWQLQAQSGLPYTPIVSGDVNGDGNAGDDRAFIFDPTRASDPALGAAMQSLMTNSEPSVARCLTSQLGRIAGRGSCEGPWTIGGGSLIMRFQPGARMPLPQRVGMTLTLANPIGAADLALHGQGNLHGWGQTVRPQSTLLYVRGFDQVADQYLYTVNPRFGASNTALNTLVTPVRLTVSFNVNVGQAREQQSLIRTLNTGRTQPGRKAPETTLQSTLSSAVLNPMAVLLRSSDSLGLTMVQADSIAELSRWFTNHADSITVPAARELAALPDTYDHSEAIAIMRDARERTFDLLIAIVPDLSRLLTDDQRRRLPAQVQQYLDVRYLRFVRSSTMTPGG